MGPAPITPWDRNAAKISEPLEKKDEAPRGESAILKDSNPFPTTRSWGFGLVTFLHSVSSLVNRDNNDQ